MKELRVFYPHSVYDRDLIDQAIKDYQEICTIKQHDSGMEISCVFSQSVTDLTVTALEFSNYLIELANSQIDA